MVAGFDIGREPGATYYSRAISAPFASSTPPPRRPRAGSVVRPVNTRLYRTAWLSALVPLLLAAFTVTRPAPLPPSVATLQPTFDAVSAGRLARELDALYPDRSPGSPSAPGAARWVQQRLAALIPDTEVDTFRAAIPGRGDTTLRNVIAVVPGRSLDTIAVVAHRDTTAGRPGLVDNASGTGALVELARAYSQTRTAAEDGVSPNHTIVFASTDAGAYGLLGARRLAESQLAARAVAVVSLDAVGSEAAPRVEIAGRGPSSPAPRLVATVLQRLREQGGPAPGTTSSLGQLLDLAFPLSLTEQLELLARDVPSVAVTTGRSGASPALGERLDNATLGRVGRATEATLSSIDASLAPGEQGRVYLQSRGRAVQGWAIALLYVTALVPFAVTLLDVLVRLRRRRVALRPAFRSYCRRLAFWLWAGALFALFGLAGAWPDGDASAVNPDSQAAGHWPRLAIALFALLLAAGWLLARLRLRPRGLVGEEDDAAGIVAALIALTVALFVAIVTNIYALLLLLPSAHAWLFLLQTRSRSPWARSALYVAGLAGPLLLLWSVGSRLGLGFDAPWYLAELTAIGYVPTVAIVVALAWAAAAAQVLTVITGRYAPYPPPRERPRAVLASAVVMLRERRARAAGEPRAGAP